jgi:uncharacterized RDD family membrane protein YckC
MYIVIGTDGKEYGPVSASALAEWYGDGRVNAGTLVRESGAIEWRPLGQIGELSDVVRRAPASAGFAPAPSRPSAGAGSAVYAGFWRRCGAILVDTVLLGIGGGLAGALTGGCMGIVMGAQGADTDTIGTAARTVGFVLGGILNWIYFTVLESSSKQATFGKRALGIVVTDLQGRRIGFGTANKRYWGKLVSFITVGFGYIMAAFTDRKQALHDLMAGTLVVKG